MILVLFSAVALTGLPRLRFDDDLESLFRGDTPEFRDYRRFSRLFGTGDQDFVILLTAPQILSIESLQRIREIDMALHQIQGLQGIYSLCHLLDRQRVGRLLLPVLPFDGAAEQAWETARQKLAEHPLGAGVLYSRDLQNTLLTFRLADTISAARRPEIMEQVTDVLRESWSPDPNGLGSRDDLPSVAEGRRFGLTGLPMLQQEVTRNLQRDQSKFTWLGLLFALGIGWCLFRKPVPVLFVAAVPFLGLGCIMGWLGWLGIPLNIVNNVITPLVLVIGFAEVIHILFLTGGFIGQGYHYREAVARMVRQLFLPCLLAALTTAIGFGSLYLSADRSLREFAVVASVASLVMFVMVLGCSSCLLATPLARYCVRDTGRQEVRSQLAAREHRPGSGWILASVVLFSLGLLVGLAWLAGRNHTDYRFTENLPERNAAVETLRRIDEAFGGSSSDQVIVRFDSKPSPEELIGILRQVRGRIESLPLVQQTTSLLNLLDSLPPRNGTDREHFRELRYLPREAWESFLQIQPTIACLHVKLPDLGSARLVPVLDRMETELTELENRHSEVTTTVTGLNVLAVRRSEQMIGDLTRSLAGASIAIFLLIVVVYRNLMFAVAAIVVNAIPMLGVAAAMSYWGQPIQYTGIMLLCVCLGLAVDDTVHFLSKLTFVLREGRDFETAVWETVMRLWPVFVTTSVMLGVGFGLAATSEIPTFQVFGGFACLALLLALIADLFVLPCWLLALHRVSKRLRGR